MLPIVINKETELRLLDTSYAEEMFSVLSDNRAHLDQWLRWSAQMQTVDDIRAHLERFEQNYANDNGFLVGIFVDDSLVGSVVCHYINHTSHKCEIGYWLAESAVGKGLITKSCLAVLKILFEDKKLNRVEMQCGVDNKRSRAVPERLGFVHEGIKRESEWVTTRYVDHVVYSMLLREWMQRKP